MRQPCVVPVRFALTLDAAAAAEQRADVALERARADELVADEVCVVRARDIVLAHRPAHVVPHLAVLVRKRCVLPRHKEARESANGPERVLARRLRLLGGGCGGTLHGLRD